MIRIKMLREEHNWSQNDLAQKLNCAPSSIAMYEKGERKPSYEVLIKLSEIFNCSIDYIVGNSNERNIKNDFNADLMKIGLSMKDYTPPTAEQKKQIEDFAKYVLKDNRKENK